MKYLILILASLFILIITGCKTTKVIVFPKDHKEDYIFHRDLNQSIIEGFLNGDTTKLYSVYYFQH